MRRPFLRCLSLTLRHLGFSCFPTTFHLLESSLSVYPKDPPSFKKSPDHPQEGRVLFSPSALKAGTGLPFSLWGYFVKRQDLSTQLGHKPLQVRCSTWHRPHAGRCSVRAHG